MFDKNHFDARSIVLSIAAIAMFAFLFHIILSIPTVYVNSATGEKVGCNINGKQYAAASFICQEAVKTKYTVEYIASDFEIK